MSKLGREAGGLGEYSDEASNENDAPSNETPEPEAPEPEPDMAMDLAPHDDEDEPA